MSSLDPQIDGVTSSNILNTIFPYLLNILYTEDLVLIFIFCLLLLLELFLYSIKFLCAVDYTTTLLNSILSSLSLAACPLKSDSTVSVSLLKLFNRNAVIPLYRYLKNYKSEAWH